jgi:hypothetical protein
VKSRRFSRQCRTLSSSASHLNSIQNKNPRVARVFINILKNVIFDIALAGRRGA